MHPLLPDPLMLDRNDSTEAVRRLDQHGYALLSAAAFTALSNTPPHDLRELHRHWATLCPDKHLRDGGHYRHRRHGSYLYDPSGLHAVPHRAHWQPTTYNALHGGMLRWFEPLEPAFAAHPAFLALMSSLAGLFEQAARRRGDFDGRWFIEVHPFRIDTLEGVGRPTPEGAHRDGVDYVAVMLAERTGIRGGESRVFQAEGPLGVRFTLDQPWSALLIDDLQVIHESTPIQPDAAPGAPSHRDTLVITFRRDGFQDPAP
jgi:hypothetical protein